MVGWDRGADRATLKENGFTEADLNGYRLSTIKPEEVAPADVPTIRANPELPVPRPKSKNEVLPPKSAEILVKAASTDLFLYLPMDGNYVRVGDFPCIPQSLVPPFPAGIQLGYKMYLENLDSEHLTGAITFTRQIVSKIGMSKTNGSTLSGELGVSIFGLSGKLSQTFTSSITTTQETDVTTTYNFSVPNSSIRVWTCWNLAEVFVLLDAKGNAIGCERERNNI
jgi:hypothetical protein